MTTGRERQAPQELRKKSFRLEGVVSCVDCYKDMRYKHVQRKIREILKVLCSFCHVGGHQFSL